MKKNFIIGLLIGFLVYKLISKLSGKNALSWGFAETLWAIVLTFILVGLYTWFTCWSMGVGG